MARWDLSSWSGFTGRGEVTTQLVIELPRECLDAIAARAAEIVLTRNDKPRRGPSPYVSVREAADYLRAKPQRVYDLLSSRRLTRYKDGSRTLVSRAELDAYLENGRDSRRIR